MMSEAREDWESYSADGKGSATKDCEEKNKVIFDVECVSLHYTRKLGNVMRSHFSRWADLTSVCEGTRTFEGDRHCMKMCFLI